jgi:hypothetical protein
MDWIRDFFLKYTNLFGTVGTVFSAVTLWLAEQGCLSTGDFTAVCNITWLPVSWMPWVTGIFLVLTAVGKLTRPGGILRSIFGGTAVVVPASSPKSGVGTVTPAQVNAP